MRLWVCRLRIQPKPLLPTSKKESAARPITTSITLHRVLASGISDTPKQTFYRQATALTNGWAYPITCRVDRLTITRAFTIHTNSSGCRSIKTRPLCNNPSVPMTWRKRTLTRRPTLSIAAAICRGPSFCTWPFRTCTSFVRVPMRLNNLRVSGRE